MKKCIAVLLILCLALSLCGFSGKTTLKGSGTEKDPYLISSAKELRKLSDLLSDQKTYEAYQKAHYRLTADIDLGNKNWTPLYWFQGTFDGDGHTVSGLKVKYAKALPGFYGSKSTDYGLFGELSGATVRDLTITGSTITVTTSGDTGALAGSAMDSVIENCHVTGSVTVTAKSNAGGLVGAFSQGSLTGCSNAATVTAGSGNAGGIAGFTSSPAGETVTIQSCTNSGTITSDDSAGGITAVLSGSALDCENKGDVTARSYAGGITASFGDGALNSNDNDNTVTLKGCTNSGNISSEKDPAGGIAARVSAGSIADCVNIGKVTGGDAEVGGIAAFFQPSAFGTAAETFTIENCENTGAVGIRTETANEAAGGILGVIYACDTEITIRGCKNSGNVDSMGKSDVFDCDGPAGGILGWGRVRSLTIADCENEAPVTGATYAGGIAGEVEPTDAETKSAFLAENCRNSGKVTAVYMSAIHRDCYAGGILGYTRTAENINGILQTLEITGCKNTGKLACIGGTGHTDPLRAGE